MEIDSLIVSPYTDAGKQYSTISLNKFKKKSDKRVGTRIVLHPKQLQAKKDILALPLYMSYLL